MGIYNTVLGLAVCAISFSLCKSPERKKPSNMVLVPKGEFMMGAKSADAHNDEFPRHPVKVDAFYMDKTEVTNADFLMFVEETGYVTIAEREVSWDQLKEILPDGYPKPSDSLLAPSSLVFDKQSGSVNLNDYSQWWKLVNGANWKNPEGPGSSIENRMDHPVVHVAHEDALAYAKWAKKRLPTEAEWEWAAMGGIENAVYPWGDEGIGQSFDKANFWQGVFPHKNLNLDGFDITAPAGSFPPNGFGLYDMAGNVWEICSDHYNINTYRQNQTTGTANNPKGADEPYDPYNPSGGGKKVIRGGSFLCSESYCSGYRTSRRMGYPVLSTANHIGFRCAKDL